MKYLLLIPILFLVGCHSAPTTVVTPEGKAAYTADQIIVQLGFLQDVAIKLEASGNLSTATTKVIVKFVVGTVSIVQATPSGATATVRAGLVELKKNLSTDEANKLASILNVISAMVQ